MVTSDLDEFAIAALRSAPADSYGIGHVAGDRFRGPHGRAWSTSWSAAPTTPASSLPWPRPSKNKTNKGGRKYALRRLNDRGTATQEVLGVGHPPADDGNDRPLLQQFIKNGELLPGWTGPEAVARARERHAASMAELPAVVNRLQRGEPAIPTVYE